MSVEVVEPGVLTSVQDALGRAGWRHLGVPVGGAADPWNARLANRLVGNPDGSALLEMTLLGASLRFGSPCRVALTGALAGTLDGTPLALNVARDVRPGAVLRVGRGEGARGYLAVGGGLAIRPLLGSVATDLRTGFGGLGGRALRNGDVLPLHASSPRPGYGWAGTWPAGPIRIVAGPHAERFASDALTASGWRVGPAADRTGVRLEGSPLAAEMGEVATMGLPLGAIQVPPDGLPIVTLADRPVTGGYPVPAVVVGADVGRVAQLRPGDEVRFVSVSLEEARSALRRAEEELAALEVLAGPADDELGWAGSHR